MKKKESSKKQQANSDKIIKPDNLENETFLKKGWWNGLGVIISIVSLIIAVLTFFMVYCQTKKLHYKTKQMTVQMNKQAEIQRMRDNIEKYLQYEWIDKAIKESNSLNDTLKLLNQKKDSTCHYYFLYKHERQIRSGHEDAAKITEECLKQLK